MMSERRGKPIQIAYVKPPCFDTVTKTDCSRRCVGCAKTCPDWAEYIEKRNTVYKDRVVNGEHKHMYGRLHTHNLDRFRKRRKAGER